MTKIPLIFIYRNKQDATFTYTEWPSYKLFAVFIHTEPYKRIRREPCEKSMWVINIHTIIDHIYFILDILYNFLWFEALYSQYLYISFCRCTNLKIYEDVCQLTCISSLNNLSPTHYLNLMWTKRDACGKNVKLNSSLIMCWWTKIIHLYQWQNFTFHGGLCLIWFVSHFNTKCSDMSW